MVMHRTQCSDNSPMWFMMPVQFENHCPRWFFMPWNGCQNESYKMRVHSPLSLVFAIQKAKKWDYPWYPGCIGVGMRKGRHSHTRGYYTDRLIWGEVTWQYLQRTSKITDPLTKELEVCLRELSKIGQWCCLIDGYIVRATPAAWTSPAVGSEYHELSWGWQLTDSSSQRSPSSNLTSPQFQKIRIHLGNKVLYKNTFSSGRRILPTSFTLFGITFIRLPSLWLLGKGCLE